MYKRDMNRKEDLSYTRLAPSEDKMFHGEPEQPESQQSSQMGNLTEPTIQETIKPVRKSHNNYSNKLSLRHDTAKHP
jgi:hypothetical protein